MAETVMAAQAGAVKRATLRRNIISHKIAAYNLRIMGV